MKRFLLLVAALSVVIPTQASAADEGTIRLTITPAVEPLPALKYQLLPKFIDRRPGNAALRYTKAMLDYRPEAKVDTQVDAWLKLPFAEFAKRETLDAVRNSHQMYKASEIDHVTGVPYVIDDLRAASRLESCDWELPIREQLVFSIKLPEVQEMRRMGRYVALRARLELAEKRYAEAVDTLAVGYMMARHVSQGPTLINGLVGVAVAAMMDRVMLDVAQAPDAPSLYWALTFQPRPLVDPRPGLEMEMTALPLSFPALRPAERSEEEWKVAAVRLAGEFARMSGMVSGEVRSAEWWANAATQAAWVVQVAARRDSLKAFLVRCGVDPKAVANMNDAQLFVEFSRLKYEDLRDDMFRWMLLPYPEARRGIEAAEQRLAQAKAGGGDDQEIIPFAALLLPAVAQVSKSYARGERRLDVLRIVEGLRLHAAKNDGRLPKSLADVQIVPLPQVDAVTGRPFEYVLKNDMAVLTLPEERGTGSKDALTYEITIAK